MIELNGRRLGVGADVAGDYASLHDGAALVDLSDRGRMRFSGGAKDALNGILTCDLAPLAPGQGGYGVALTSKGKVVADVSVFLTETGALVQCSAAAWPGWKQLVAKYINPRLAPRTDETEMTGAIGIFGPDSSRIVSAIAGTDRAALDALALYSHLSVATGADAMEVARIPDLGVDGYQILMPRASFESVRARAIATGTRAIGTEVVESARIEAGRPVWGVDMDESTLPQEVNLEALNAISFTKGCYTGQEVVARLHFRGHVNRRLMGLRIDGLVAPARGTELKNIEDNACGDIRSSIVSPRFGPIALGMVRREIDVGARVTVRIDDNDVRAEVSALPFVD